MIELIDAQPTLHPEPGRRQFSLQSHEEDSIPVTRRAVPG